MVLGLRVDHTHDHALPISLSQATGYRNQNGFQNLTVYFRIFKPLFATPPFVSQPRQAYVQAEYMSRECLLLQTWLKTFCCGASKIFGKNMHLLEDENI